MKRKTEFDESKIYQVSTSAQVISAYLDSFGIEKVHFRMFEYESKKNIDIYVDFATISLIANEISTGRLFKQVKRDTINLLLMVFQRLKIVMICQNHVDYLSH